MQMGKKKTSEPSYIAELREALAAHRNEIVLLLQRCGRASTIELILQHLLFSLEDQPYKP